MDINLAEIIHDIWPIEEYANSGRRLVWFIPPIPPTRAPNKIENKITGFDELLNINKKISIGLIFCHEIRTSAIGHLNFDIIIGNHQWHGVIPSFIRSLINKVVKIKLFEKIVSVWKFWIIIIEIIKVEAQAWVKKYLVVASVSWFIEGVIIIGMNDKRFSSKPIHIINHLLVEIEIIVPRIRVEENRKIKGKEDNIKGERSRTSRYIVRSYILHRVSLKFVSLKTLLVIHGVTQK